MLGLLFSFASSKILRVKVRTGAACHKGTLNSTNDAQFLYANSDYCSQSVTLISGLSTKSMICSYYGMTTAEYDALNPTIKDLADSLLQVGMTINIKVPCPTPTPSVESLSMSASVFSGTCLATNGSSFIDLCYISGITSASTCYDKYGDAWSDGYVDSNCVISSWSKLVYNYFGAQSAKQSKSDSVSTNTEVLRAYSTDSGVHYVVTNSLETSVVFDPSVSPLTSLPSSTATDRVLITFSTYHYRS